MSELWNFTGSFFEVFNALVAGFCVGWSLRGIDKRTSKREEAVAPSLDASGGTVVIKICGRGGSRSVELAPEKPANGGEASPDGQTDGDQSRN